MFKYIQKNIFLFISIFFLIVSLFLIYYFFIDKENYIVYDNKVTNYPENINTKLSTPESNLSVTSGISSINIYTENLEFNVIPVGVDKDGYIKTMNNANDIVWYERTGTDVSNMIIAGHSSWLGEKGLFLDSEFWDKGTELEVTFLNGKKEKFILTSKYKYIAEDTPNDVLDTEKGVYRVTVMTCIGEYVEGVGSKYRVYNVFTKK